MITEYRIISENTTSSLCLEVIKFIGKGYQPLGAPFLETYNGTTVGWFQAVVKIKE